MSNYLSVSEYAKLNGKDPGNIRRLLASNRIEGKKIGSQWVIHKDTKYPNDKRRKNGNYHNWRKRLNFNKQKELNTTLSKIIEELQTIYGNNLLQVILYGSYARGTHTNESDVDVALMLQETPSRLVTKKMIDCVSNYELECGKVLSFIDINYDKYNQLKDDLPFYKNIKKEGIVLWKTTT